MLPIENDGMGERMGRQSASGGGDEMRKDEGSS